MRALFISILLLTGSSVWAGPTPEELVLESYFSAVGKGTSPIAMVFALQQGIATEESLDPTEGLIVVPGTSETVNGVEKGEMLIIKYFALKGGEATTLLIEARYEVQGFNHNVALTIAETPYGCNLDLEGPKRGDVVTLIPKTTP